jgi:DNA-binding response OmpR family regulator
VLRRSGYRVLQAATPAHACELFEAHREDIDLLVSDVVMPNMNGPALAQRLIGQRPDLRILFISGYADSVGPLDSISPNVSFLGKPFQGSALAERVRELLARAPQPHTRTPRAEAGR